MIKPNETKVTMLVYDFDVPNEEVWHDRVHNHIIEKQVEGWGLQTMWSHNGRYQFSMIRHGDEDTEVMKRRRSEALEASRVEPPKKCECKCCNH